MRDTTARKNSIALLTLLLLLSMHGAAGAADPLLALGWYDGFHLQCHDEADPIHGRRYSYEVRRPSILEG